MCGYACLAGPDADFRASDYTIDDECNESWKALYEDFQAKLVQLFRDSKSFCARPAATGHAAAWHLTDCRFCRLHRDGVLFAL